MQGIHYLQDTSHLCVLLVTLFLLHQNVYEGYCKRLSQPLEAQIFNQPLQNDLNQATNSMERQPTQIRSLKSPAATPLTNYQATERARINPTPSAILEPVGHSQTPSSGPPLSSVRLKWRQLDQSISISISEANQNFGHKVDELLLAASVQNKSVSNQCKQSLRDLVSGLKGHELWASQMMDASAAFRLPSGLLEGTLTDLGNFDQCLAVSRNRPVPVNKGHAFNGQYCSLLIKPPLISRPRLHTICRRLPNLTPTLNNLSGTVNGFAAQNSTALRLLAQQSHQFFYTGLRLGLCLPSKCSQLDVEQLLQAYLARFELIGQVKHCQLSMELPQADALAGGGSELDGLNFQSAQSIGSRSGRKSAHPLAFIPLVSSISQKFDPTQQCILLAFLVQLTLIAIGTLLDRSKRRVHSFICRSTGSKGHAQADLVVNRPLTSNQGSADASGNCWRHYQVCQTTMTSNSDNWTNRRNELAANARGKSNKRPDSNRGDGSAAHAFSRAELAGKLGLYRDANYQLGLQRNPLLNLAAGPKKTTSDCAVEGAVDESPRGVSNDQDRNHAQLDWEFSMSPLTETNRAERAKIAASLQTTTSNAFKESDKRLIRDLKHPMAGSNRLQRTVKAGGGGKSDECDGESGPFFRRLLICFSLKNNLREIGKQSRPTIGVACVDREAQTAAILSDVKVIHGLRTLAMIWLIFGHTIGLVSPEMMNNLFALVNLSCSSRFFQAILNTTLAVDTFFMISGLVTVISFVRKCSSAATLIGFPELPITDLRKQLRSNARDCAYSCKQENNLRNQAQLRLKAYKARTKKGLHGASQEEATSAANDVSSIESLSSSMESTATSSGGDSSNRFLASKSSSQKKFITHKELRAYRDTSPQYYDLGFDGTHQSIPTPAGAWPSDFRPLTWLVLRYIRLTPAYAATIGLAILLPALGSGPFWPETVGQVASACRENWWTNVFYVNNFLETDNLCLIHSWYLSNDWQFAFLALVLLGLLYKSRKLAVCLLIAVFVSSSALTFTITVENDFPPTIVTTSTAVAERLQYIYSLYCKPWPHLPSYLVGLVVGFMVLKWRIASNAQVIVSDNRIKSQSLDSHKDHSTSSSSMLDTLGLSQTARLFCWLLFCLISLAVLNSVYPWNMGLSVDPVLTGLHSATFRTLWAACCGWLVFALVSKPRNPLALLLSWHGFQITSRLTYCTYLIHPLVIYFHFGTLRERIDSSVYGLLHRFMATVLISYLLAFLLSLCVEGPSIQLQKLFACLLARSKRNFIISTFNKSNFNSQSKTRRRRNDQRATGHSLTPLSGVELECDKSFWSASNSSRRIDRDCIDGDNNDNEDNFDDDGLNAYQISAAGRSANCSSNSMRHTRAHSNSLESPSKLKPPPDLQRSSEASLLGDGSRIWALNHSGCECGESRAASGRLEGGAVNEDFQQRLAQAIGRGFRIRSKIVNSASALRPAIAETHQTAYLPGDGDEVESSGRMQLVERPHLAEPVVWAGQFQDGRRSRNLNQNQKERHRSRTRRVCVGQGSNWPEVTETQRRPGAVSTFLAMANSAGPCKMSPET